MKKFYIAISLLLVLFFTNLTVGAQEAPPPLPFKIGGSVTIDGVEMTQASFSGYTIEVTKDDGTAYDPVAEISALTDTNKYIVEIPIKSASQTGGADTGDTAVIHIYQGETELAITSPTDGEVTVGSSGSSDFTVNIVAEGPKTLTITTSDTSDNGSTTPAEGSVDHAHGEVVNISATADSGWSFAGWTGDTDNIASASSASTTITMNADATIAATYTVCNKTLTVGVNDAQMGSATPESGTQACDAVVQITATPEAGYSFVNWTGDVANANSATTTVTMDEDQSVTANFSAITYTLTVTAPTNGSITLDPTTTGNVYAEDQVVAVTAVPSTGYLFDAWTGDLSSATTIETTITMDEDKTISATFIECLKTLTMAVNDAQMGSTDPTGTTNQSCDADVTITATPEDHYSFVNWTGDTVLDANSAETTVTMVDDMSVTANFTAITHTLTMTASDNGTTTPAAGDHDYAEPAVVTISAVPATGYVFSSWTGDVANATTSSTTVTMDEDQTVTPVFALDSDNDGTADTSEQGPDGTDTAYDGNGDGTADSAQANVTSTYNAEETPRYVTIATAAANTLDAEPIANPDEEGTPSGVTLDFGFYDITVSGLTAGGATTVTITLPEDADEPDTYYKYSETDGWYEFLYDETTETGAEFDGNVITLHFVDGLRGDDDGTANGTIVDPGAPGIVAAASDDDNCFIQTASSDSKNVNMYGASAVAGFLFLMVFGFVSYRRK